MRAGTTGDSDEGSSSTIRSTWSASCGARGCVRDRRRSWGLPVRNGQRSGRLMAHHCRGRVRPDDVERLGYGPDRRRVVGPHRRSIAERLRRNRLDQGSPIRCLLHCGAGRRQGRRHPRGVRGRVPRRRLRLVDRLPGCSGASPERRHVLPGPVSRDGRRPGGRQRHSHRARERDRSGLGRRPGEGDRGGTSRPPLRGDRNRSGADSGHGLGGRYDRARVAAHRH